MNKSIPLVSIIIPVYNQHVRYLSEAIASALAQTYGFIELVVSDNHSTNDVPAYLNTIHDKCLRVVKPPVFLPMVQHFQYAADQATGDYIMFLCSDDWVYPTCVEVLIHAMQADSTIVVGYGEIESVNNDNLEDIKFYYNRKNSGIRSAKNSLNELLRARPVFGWIPGGIMRRSAYQQVREVLSGSFNYSFDFALLFKLHELGNVVYVDTPVAKFRFWTPQQGKQGGDRMLESITDVGRICTMLETSPALLNLIEHGALGIKEWRLYQAKRWVLNLFVGLISDNISREKCRAGIDTIRRELYPITNEANLLRWLSIEPQVYIAKPLFGNLYTLYLTLQKKIKIGL